ncbi:MAG: hypothetical protein O7C98_09775, partial [Planctomycetota bacterium]|nr:hypothetical protein [Planctomycetota bacterium]
MKFWLSFSSLLLVLITLLLVFGGREIATSGLVLRESGRSDAPVLRDTDFVEAGEMPPFPGRLTRVEGLELTQEENGHVRMTVTIEEVVREGDKPRLRNVVARIYDEPSAEDLERRRRPLRATLHSRFVDGEPPALVRRKRGKPLPVRMEGAVLKDEHGRVRFDVPHIDLDVEHRTGHTEERVSYRDPDRRLTLHGTGLTGGLDLREVHLLKQVRATFPLRNATASFHTPGRVTVRELDEGLLRVETAGTASLEHPFFAADCGRLVVHLEGSAQSEDGGYTPAVWFAQQGVEIRFDPKQVAGLTHARADLARGEDERVYLEGNLTARRTGPFELFGKGDHTVEFKAPKGVLDGLGPGQKDQEVRFRFDGGVQVRQVGGPGVLEAGMVRGEAYGSDRGVLIAEQDVSCNTRDFALRAQSLRASRDAQGAELIELGGDKQLRYRLDKPLKLQGVPRHGDLVIQSRGPLTMRATGKGQFLFARDAVEMVLETPPRKGRPGRELTRLVCRELVVHTMDGVVVSLT